jgi:hypothetical protein
MGKYLDIIRKAQQERAADPYEPTEAQGRDLAESATLMSDHRDDEAKRGNNEMDENLITSQEAAETAPVELPSTTTLSKYQRASAGRPGRRRTCESASFVDIAALRAKSALEVFLIRRRSNSRKA